ncbi:hypothetical protein SDRG_11872 [Saprolegnia diclina VS20]|uniref:Uncharacterized protein n=1 Tax=Saprolegnia diclina (strain VS20) TaxID=1156394 RepID=T0Q9X8_SAPDV|nr:hypothetical protein SDRG_11872 [Saprolegnia diclina VS20]EQC30295.1 hypothetical protein SDRG_11872 [Saprolegnia diclina VS20]|eukprot:XP_008616148.1 hypothetical protein SDRG_11872 [Saprolegnia diclina VS20]
MRMFAQYCWVDMGRVYELSTTARRQARCDRSMTHNGAVYWEPLLRNSLQQDVAHSSYSSALQASIFDVVQSSPSGSVWLASLWAKPWPIIADEVAFWHANGLTYWQTQLTNYYEQGLQETIEIENALGLRTSITIHSTSQSYRGLSVWSLVYTYAGVWNDLLECQVISCSLIRGANAYSDMVKQEWDVRAYRLPVNDTLVQLVGTEFGTASPNLLWPSTTPL